MRDRVLAKAVECAAIAMSAVADEIRGDLRLEVIYLGDVGDRASDVNSELDWSEIAA